MIKCVLIVSLMGVSLADCANNGSLSGNVYTASETKQAQSVIYGTIVRVCPVQTQGDDDANVVGVTDGAVFGEFLGNTVGGGTGRLLATVVGAVAGGVAGQSVQGATNEAQGAELGIRKDGGSAIMMIQKQGATRFSAGQRVVMANSDNQVIVSPR